MDWIHTKSQKLKFVVCLLFLFTLFHSPSAAAQGTGRRIALVIGNGNYSAATHLPNPGNDARLVADAVRRVGFEAVVANDLSLANMNRALREFRDRAAGAEVALVYFAGHGIENGGKNWLIPTDATLRSSMDLAYEAVDLDRLLEAVSGAQTRMIVLDACRNNPFARSWPGGTRSFSRGLARVEVDNVLIIYSAAPGQVAADGVGGNSPFATSFARRLVQPGLPLQFLGGTIRDDVIRATGDFQRPYVSASITGTPVYLIQPADPAAQPPSGIAHASRPTPGRQRLGAELQSLLSFRNSNLAELAEGGVYFFLVSDLPSVASGLPYNGLTVFVVRNPRREFTRICEVERGVYAVGLLYSLNPNDPNGMAQARMLNRSDLPLISGICRGLASRVTSLSALNTRQTGVDTVFDWLSRSSEGLALYFVTPTIFNLKFEDNHIRYYWASTFTNRYSNMAARAQVEADPDLASQEPVLRAGGIARIRSPIRNFQHLATGQGIGAYPTRAREEFGDNIAELDVEWLQFLQNATVSIGGRDLPMLQPDGSSLLRVFTTRDFASSDFWRSAHDARVLMQQADCLAGRFLRREGYASPMAALGGSTQTQC